MSVNWAPPKSRAHNADLMHTVPDASRNFGSIPPFLALVSDYLPDAFKWATWGVLPSMMRTVIHPYKDKTIAGNSNMRTKLQRTPMYVDCAIEWILLYMLHIPNFTTLCHLWIVRVGSHSSGAFGLFTVPHITFDFTTRHAWHTSHATFRALERNTESEASPFEPKFQDTWAVARSGARYLHSLLPACASWKQLHLSPQSKNVGRLYSTPGPATIPIHMDKLNAPSDTSTSGPKTHEYHLELEHVGNFSADLTMKSTKFLETEDFVNMKPQMLLCADQNSNIIDLASTSGGTCPWSTAQPVDNNSEQGNNPLTSNASRRQYRFPTQDILPKTDISHNLGFLRTSEKPLKHVLHIIGHPDVFAHPVKPFVYTLLTTATILSFFGQHGFATVPLECLVPFTLAPFIMLTEPKPQRPDSVPHPTQPDRS
ncbi:hypothetical protein T440DRAFT_465372 [Plenodomus tracheiphilus IPT5]|uniref:Uncharacterized protein n=1 Tax=Plenodomus tracheiphilus IPT5 TaxID=1408161 RepID=A0A6A7BG33_9PLEO|nr:hypothetical protein T440DRAFT_465372 [Plenodomus tracheiphilus IPT5]